jgi:hypothetical protein
LEALEHPETAEVNATTIIVQTMDNRRDIKYLAFTRAGPLAGNDSTFGVAKNPTPDLGRSLAP